MGGGSSTAISNWGGMYQPLEQIYNTAQTNHGAWYGTYAEEAEKWRKEQKERQEAWLKINYGWENDLYDPLKPKSGGVYGDARRSEARWRKVQLAIAAMQQVASFYFADKQYKAAKEAQDHQIEVWKTEKEWAKRYQDLWYYKYLPLEMKLLNKIKARFDDPEYSKPRYDVVQSRAVVVVRSEMAKAREQVRRCIDPRCVGSMCNTLKQLAFEEAKMATGAIEKGYRAEEARADVKKAEIEESAFQLAKLGRGLATASLGALNSASQAAQIAATYNPYDGYEVATGNAFNYWHDWSVMTKRQSGQQGNILDRQATGFLMTTRGLSSSPNDMVTQPPVPVNGVTGTTNAPGYVQGLNYMNNTINGGVFMDDINITSPYGSNA